MHTVVLTVSAALLDWYMCRFKADDIECSCPNELKQIVSLITHNMQAQKKSYACALRHLIHPQVRVNKSNLGMIDNFHVLEDAKISNSKEVPKAKDECCTTDVRFWNGSYL